MSAVLEGYVHVKIAACSEREFDKFGAVEWYLDTHMQVMDEKLKVAKSKMDKYNVESVLHKWLAMQKIIDIYRDMRRLIENKYGAQNVSNAWMKYYEIYSTYITDPPKLAFFNAELPGSSLCAFNHFMRTKRTGSKFKWYASSFTEGDGLEDMYGIMKLNKDSWLCGADNNGDCTDIRVLKKFEARLGPSSAVGGVDFYSHDAGMDVTEDYNNQESINSRLHLGCALAGFMVMKIGATFVGKQYTIFNTLSFNLVMIYSSMFSEFYIDKPLTSRPYNSEIYLVGVGFLGMNASVRSLLENLLINWNQSTALIPASLLTTTYLDTYLDIRKLCELTFENQVEFLNKNIGYFEKWHRNFNGLKRIFDAVKHKNVERWLGWYDLVKIDKGLLIRDKRNI